jgi:signal transduction histidine kinase
VNSSLDEAIAAAVTTYAHESQSRASIKQYEASERGNERVGFLVHELRNLVNTAIVAFEVVKTGNVGVSGSTGGVLQRSLLGLRDLIAHSLDEVRMIKGTTNRRRIVVANFIQDVADSARLAANARGIKLSVPPVDHDIAIDGDEQILAAVLGNLLQNATKFTHSDTEVALRVKASADRVLIEVEDECGGLPGGGDAKELTALNDGRLYARNLPGRGCVFTVDLPRAMAPTPA